MSTNKTQAMPVVTTWHLPKREPRPDPKPRPVLRRHRPMFDWTVTTGNR